MDVPSPKLRSGPQVDIYDPDTQASITPGVTLDQGCLRTFVFGDQLFALNQRKRDDNKNKICVFQGGGGWAGGAERKIVQNAFFRGKRHDNKILNVRILLSRNFVVMAQAPTESGFQMVFFNQYPEVGPKVGFGVQKWVKMGQNPLFLPI